jgi:hypothetical protein
VQYIQVTNLANTSSLVYHSLLSFPTFGDGPSSVNRGVVSSLLYSISFTHAPRAAPSFSWTAGCQLEKENKILAPFEITYSSLRILHRLLLISDSKYSNRPLRCFQPLNPIARGALLRQACLSVH